MQKSRIPGPALRPFVETLWASWPEGPDRAGARERVLPTGDPHIVFLLGREPLRLERPDTGEVHSAGFALVAGPRAAAYVKDVSRRSPSAGAQLRPGSIPALLGVPAGELAGRHWALADFWGPHANEAHERLAHESQAEARLDLLERLLASRLPRLRGLHPAVAQALAGFSPGGRVSEVVAETGYSQRRFNELFVASVGLTPKLHCRLQRFRAVLSRSGGARAWADLAQEAGYADQAHLAREFREFAGMTPGEWRRLAPAAPHHVLTSPSS